MTSSGGSNGGSTSNGGSASNGGTTSNGGSTTSGGTTTSGGARTGGSTTPGGTMSGGASGTGGSLPAGGTTASGGTSSSGGTSTTGGTSAKGGTTATGGTTGAGGGTGSGKICKFASGLNVAWVSFANDVPTPSTSIPTFTKIFKDTYDNGGRVARWWFHTNGTVTPGYNSDGTVKKIPQTHIDGVKSILAAANSVGIGVVISLWSFDMAQSNAGSAAANNKNLMIQDSIRQSYIDNYLTDLVKGLKGTPGLYAYEIFNEPEGMSVTGWADQWKIEHKYIQTTVNWWAAAIKAADPTIPVTNGSQTMQYKANYTDSALVAAGSKPTGTLDFYEVHYYQVNGASNNVFANPRSYWSMPEKKLVIGEFAAYATDTSPVAVNDSFTYLYNNGYDGAWAWSYTEGNGNYKWPSMQTPMKTLYTAQQATVSSCP